MKILSKSLGEIHQVEGVRGNAVKLDSGPVVSKQDVYDIYNPKIWKEILLCVKEAKDSNPCRDKGNMIEELCAAILDVVTDTDN